jgi:hypothetical protein
MCIYAKIFLVSNVLSHSFKEKYSEQAIKQYWSNRDVVWNTSPSLCCKCMPIILSETASYIIALNFLAQLSLQGLNYTILLMPHHVWVWLSYPTQAFTQLYDTLFLDEQPQRTGRPMPPTIVALLLTLYLHVVLMVSISFCNWLFQ